MFDRLGASVWGHPWRWVTAWAALTVLLGVSGPSLERIVHLRRIEPASLLPPDEPYNIAVDLERRAFPELASRTRTVLIFERDHGLHQADYEYLADLTRRLQLAAGPGPERQPGLAGWRVQSPVSQPYLRSRLLSTSSSKRFSSGVMKRSAPFRVWRLTYSAGTSSDCLREISM